MNDVAAHLDGIRNRPAAVLALMFDHASTAVCAIRDGHLVYVNHAAARLWCAPTVAAVLYRPARDCFVESDPVGPITVGASSTVRVRRYDATTLPVEVTVLHADPTLGSDLRLLVLHASSLVSVGTDDPVVAEPARLAAAVPEIRAVSGRARSPGDGRGSTGSAEGLDRLTEMSVAGLDEGIVIVDRQARVLWANAAAIRITALREGDSLRSLDLRTEDDADVFPNMLPGHPPGYSPDDSPGHSPGHSAGHSPGHSPGRSRGLDPAIDDGDDERPADLLCRFDRGNGESTWLSVACAPLPDDAYGHAVVSVVDISERQRVAERLLYVAGHDELTGLPGRSLLIERIATALAGRAAGRLGALMFIDVDRLKMVNDTHGHLAGDEVLRTLAQRLRANLRREDVIGRLGGDEFVVLVLGCRQAGDVVSIADRLQRQFDEPMVISVEEDAVHAVAVDPVVVSVGASIGIVTIDDGDRRAPRRLLAEADSAMYRVKRAGRDGIAPGQPLRR